MRFISRDGSMSLDRNIRLRAINLLKSASFQPLVAGVRREISQEILET
jgi:hypothetical protein